MKVFPIIDAAATGANILRLRKARGMTVSDLQHCFGFEAPQAIYKWQRGDSLPSMDNMLVLGFLLGVPLEKIIVFQLITEEEPRDSRGSFSTSAIRKCA